MVKPDLGGRSRRPGRRGGFALVLPQTPPIEAKAEAEPLARKEAALELHRITSFQALRARHDAYQRELEQLAIECERLLPVLKDSLVWQLTSEGEAERARGIKYVATEIEKRLKKILLAGEVDGPAPSVRGK